MLTLHGKSVCFCKAKNNQKFRLQGNVRSKGHVKLKMWIQHSIISITRLGESNSKNCLVQLTVNWKVCYFLTNKLEKSHLT